MEPRAPLLPRVLAITLSVALEASASGAAGIVLFGASLARAEGEPAQFRAPAAVPPPGPLQPAQVMAYLEAQGIFKNADDPLRSYMILDGKVTAMGDAAFRYFMARPRDIKSFTQELDKLREAGPLDAKRAEQIEQALASFNEQFGGIGSGGSNEDAFSLGAKLHTLLTGAAEQREQRADDLAPGSAGYVQVDRGDAFEFHDKEGLLIKTTKPRLTPEGDRKARDVMAKLGQPLPAGQEIDVASALAILQAAGEVDGPEDPRAKPYYIEGGMQTWNRQIEAQQKAMNESKPPNAPMVPLNGRYNREMFEWSYWAMRQQVEETKLQLKVDRMARLAELLGKQFRDDQWYKDPKLEQQLLDEAGKKTFSQLWLASRGPQFDAACGRKVANTLDLVECKLKARVLVVQALEERLAAYQNRVDTFKDVNIISQDQFVSVQRGELMVRKYVTLAWIEGQRWRADAQLERLDFSAPDHAALKKTIDESPLSKDEKPAYERRGLELVDRIQRLKRSYSALQDTLTTADFATALDRVQGTLAQTQKELGEAELDFRLYAAMPGLAKAAKDDTSGMINGAWKWTSERLNTAHNYWSNGMKFDSNDGNYIQGTYLDNRRALAGYSGAFDNVSRLVAQGKWEDARAAIIKADPRAIQTHGKDMSLRGGEAGDAERIEAVFKKVGDSMTQVANQHFWVRVAGQFVLWSVGTAIFAPAAGALLSGMSRATLAGASALARGGRIARTTGFFVKAGGEILEHSAIRLTKLSPTAAKVKSEWALISRLGIRGAPIRALDATMKRSLVVGSRVGAFSGMSATISGGFTAGGHLVSGVGAGIGAVKEKGLGAVFDGSAAKVVWSGGESAFASPVDAGMQGVKFGAQWALDDWHPLLGMGFGLPSSIVEGKRFAGPLAENLASRGTLGNAAKLTEWASRGWLKPATRMDKWMQGAVKAGGTKGTFATTFGLADNISKYMLFSQGIGKVAHFASWQLNSAEAQNLERRVKRARMAEISAMEMPYWLMLPVFPARFEVQAAMQARQSQGYRELQKLGELDVLANSAEGQQQYLRGRQEVPVIQRIFQWNPWAEEGNFGSYTVTKDMKYDAIREVLPSEVTGKAARDPITGKSTLDPYSVNPLEYLRVSRKPAEDGKVTKVGRLALGDEVRDQAHALFEESIIRKGELARKILDPKNVGREVEGFGTVRPEHAEEVARVLYRHAKELGLTGEAGAASEVGMLAKLRGRLPGAADTAELVKLLPNIQKRLAPYLNSEGNVAAKARALLLTLAKTDKPSAEFKQFMDALVDRSSELSANWDKQGHADYHKPWNELVAEFRNDARWRAGSDRLGPAEREVIVKTLDFFDAIHARFNAFNKVDVTYGRMLELLQAHRSEAQGTGNRALAKGFDRMLNELNGWKRAEPRVGAAEPRVGAAEPRVGAAEPGADIPVQDKGSNQVADPAKPGKQTSSYNAMLHRLRGGIEKDPALSAADREALTAILGEMDAAPWLLHDSKGSALPGWRAQQFEALMTFVGGLNTGGAEAAKTIRVFQMLKTGGGKTLLAYEGLLPIADADAALRGGKKVLFLTVLSNLEAQARMEFRAMRKLTTNMEIDTWENFKTKIAQGKTQGRGGADDYWILGDEMDGAALQPALTIGETTAYVSREHPAYRNLKGGIEKVERMLSADARELGQKLRFEGNRQKTILDGVGQQDPHLARALREGAERLLKLGEKLGNSRGSDLGKVRAEVERVLGEQQLILDASADFGAGSAKFLQAQGKLSGLVDEIAGARTAKGLSTKLAEAKTQLAEQLREISTPEAVKSAQARAMRPALQAAMREIEGLLSGLNGKGAKGAKAAKGGPTVGGRTSKAAEPRVGAAEALQRLASEEQAILRAGSKRDAGRMTEFADAGKQIREAAMDAGAAEPADPKVMGKQLRKLMGEQENVLWRGKWKSGDAASKLQIERLTNEARAKRAKADALRPTDRAQAGKLDGEVAAREAQVLALLSRPKAMQWLKDNGNKIVETAEKGGPGWEGQVRELLTRRRGVLDAALEHENPIYGIFSKMKEKMVPLYASKLRVQNDSMMRLGAAERLEHGGLKQREALVERLEALAKRLEARRDPGAAAARELHTKAQTELTAWKDGQLVRRAIESKEPAELKTARESWQKASDELGRIDAKLGETSGKIDRLFADAKAFREDAATAKPKQAVELTKKADLAESQAKQGLGELETFRREATAKNSAARELLAVFMEKNQAFLKKNLPEVVRSFEEGAGQNAEAWVAELKAKGFDADGLRARTASLNAQADAATDAAAAAKLRSQASQVQNDLAAVEQVFSELGSRPRLWRTEGQRLKMDSDAALKAHFERIDGVSTSELAGRLLLKYTGARWVMEKIPGVRNLGASKPIVETTFGLTRTYADKLLKAIATDPFLTPAQRWQLMWNIMPSAIWPRGIGYHFANWKGTPILGAAAAFALGFPMMSWQFALTSGGIGLLPTALTKGLGIQPSGETWVRRELFNLARGYTDNPATERFDNITKKVNAVHNGQWFETMDTPTRRFWELHYGSDLTLPYEHKAIVTMNDFVRDNKNVRFVGLSGTAGLEFRRYLHDNAVRLSGDRLASTGAKDIAFELYSGPAGKFDAVLRAVKAMEKPKGLVVLITPEWQTGSAIEQLLIRQGMKQDQIAKVFPDAELLRVNNPNANVSKQTNLHNLTTGRVKVLILDSRVGGRGLDLNFKGARGGNNSKAFRGYPEMEMLIIDPQDMTVVHNIQAQGRIDLGRVNPGTKRNFHLVMDVRLAQRDPVFMEMLRVEPRFERLRQDPAVRAIAARAGRLVPEWLDVHEHIQGLEATGQRRDLTVPYRDMVRDYLAKKQGEVELDQLRSSSVKQDRPAFNPLMRGLEGWAR